MAAYVVSRKGSNQVHGRAAIADMLCPDNGLRGTMKRRGLQVKNHMKENVMGMRALERRVKDRAAEADIPEKKLYKLEQFRNVNSRVFDGKTLKDSSNNNNNSFDRRDEGEDYDDDRSPRRGQYEGGRRPSMGAADREFLTRGVAEKRREEIAKNNMMVRAEMDRKLKEQMALASDSGKPVTPRKGSVPKADEIARLAPRTNADFIERNKVRMQALVPPTQREGDSTVASKHDSYGRVPAYLEERKAQWEEEKEERKKRMPDPNCPKGMKLMPEDERLQTLEVLVRSKDEATKQLMRMPFVIETPSLKRKQGALEAKLREIENAIDLFSKPKVYIAMNE